MAEATAASGDRSHLCSGALLDVIPPGWGNRWEGRYLKQHFRITAAALQSAGTPITESHHILLVRLARVGLEVKRFERRVDRGDSDVIAAECRHYHSLSTSYMTVLREIVLRPPRANRSTPADDPTEKPPPSLDDILVEMEAAR
jgi:hypothetical protein